jgi:hypothetical protein
LTRLLWNKFRTSNTEIFKILLGTAGQNQLLNKSIIFVNGKQFTRTSSATELSGLNPFSETPF